MKWSQCSGGQEELGLGYVLGIRHQEISPLCFKDRTITVPLLQLKLFSTLMIFGIDSLCRPPSLSSDTRGLWSAQGLASVYTGAADIGGGEGGDVRWTNCAECSVCTLGLSSRISREGRKSSHTLSCPSSSSLSLCLHPSLHLWEVCGLESNLPQAYWKNVTEILNIMRHKHLTHSNPLPDDIFIHIQFCRQIKYFRTIIFVICFNKSKKP